MPAVTFSGLASGLDTEALVRAILDAESVPVRRLEDRRSLFDKQKAALTELEGKLGDLKSTLSELASPRSFRSRTSSVADESLLRATPSSGAELGLFDIAVTNLAQASKFKSAGLSDPDQSLVSDGQITITRGEENVTIDVSATEGTDNLSAIRDAINDADIGAQAAIVFDGTNYLLTVRSEETGTDNAIAVTDTTNLGLAQFQAAEDAALTIDGIDITSSSNTVTSALPGTTLELLDVGTTSVEVATDDERIVENTQSLIDKYNELIDFFNAQFRPETRGPLAGDSTTRGIQQRLQLLFTGGVEGIVDGGLRALSSIGVSFDGQTGKATLDTSVLQERLDDDFEAVGDLFLESGRATDRRIGFVSSANETAPGTYAINITTAAQQATVLGSDPIAALGQPETLTISDGTTSVDVDLAAGLTGDEVATAINDALEQAGVSAIASTNGGRLQINSRGFGSAATIEVTSDLSGVGFPGTTTGFSSTPSTDEGVDVAGTINGLAATGSGQTLTSDTGDSEGLTIRVTASQSVIDTLGGDFGTLSFSRGLVAAALTEVERVIRVGDGPIETVRDSLEDGIDQINDDIERLEARLAIRERQLLQTFAKAEQAIQSLQSQQTAFQSLG